MGPLYLGKMGTFVNFRYINNLAVWYALIFWLKQKQSADLGIYLVSMSLLPINLCVPLVSSLQRSATPPQQLQ